MDITKEVKEKVLEYARDIFREYSINMNEYSGQIYPITTEANFAEVDILFDNYSNTKALKIENLVFELVSGKVIAYKDKKLV